MQIVELKAGDLGRRFAGSIEPDILAKCHTREVLLHHAFATISISALPENFDTLAHDDGDDDGDGDGDGASLLLSLI